MFRRPKTTARTVAELTVAADPAWPSIRTWIDRSPRTAQVLPGAAAARLETLHRLQVTTHSVLGAVAAETSGMLLDHGWLRVLGGGGSDLVDVATASGVTAPGEPPSSVVVAYDVIGGRFAINGGALPVAMGEVAYLGPDTLAWNGTGQRHSGWLEWVLTGDVDGFYRQLRWPGWQDDASSLALDHGLAVIPPAFTGRRATSRTVVPWADLVATQQEYRVKLLDVPDGDALRLRVDTP